MSRPAGPPHRWSATPYPLVGSSYIPALDGLRAISVLFVMVRHFEITHLVSANLGVTIFFFISGFIITRLLLDEHDRTGTISLRAFYVRRIMRLTPALWLVLLVVPLAAIGLHKEVDWYQVGAGFLYLMNYYSIWLRSEDIAYALPINPLWSLAVEEHFYLLFPVLLTLTVAWKSRLAGFIVGVIVLSLLWRVFNIYVLDFPPKYNYFATESRIESILWGCLLATLCAWKPAIVYLKTVASWPFFLVGCLGLIVSMVPISEGISHSVRYSLQGGSLFLLFSATLFSPSFGWARRMLSLPLAAYMGKISYPLYLWHLPAIWFTNQFLGDYTIQSITVATLSSFALAAMTYHLVEIPVRRARATYAAAAQ
jgi:peptidoglycan/LPS O-acetylase OafA/YrhL